MSAVIVDLGRVRRAVAQSARMGIREPQQAVVARLVADSRDRQPPATAPTPLTPLAICVQQGADLAMDPWSTHGGSR